MYILVPRKAVSHFIQKIWIFISFLIYIPGKPKIWYIIHKSSVNDLLALVDQVHPDDPSCNNVPRHKDLLSTSYFLKKKSISFDTNIQEPGQFVVSLSRCFHIDFNLGNNIAEAVNFATDSWIPYGHDAVSCNCSTKSSPLLRSFMGLSQLRTRTLHLVSEQLQIKTNLETQNQVIVQLQTQTSQLHSQNDYLKSLLISQKTPSIPVSFIPQADLSSPCSSIQLSQPSRLHVVPSAILFSSFPSSNSSFSLLSPLPFSPPDPTSPLTPLPSLSSI